MGAASIRYTIDGSVPSESNGTVCSGTLSGCSVTVSSSLTLKAIAYQNGWNDSLVNSATYNFAPAAPTLSSPPNQAVGQPTTPTLTWQAVSGATSYTVYLDTFNPPQQNYTVTGASFTPSAALQGSGIYYWYVVGNSGSMAGPASATWSFSVVATPTTTIASSPTGLQMTVDSLSYTTPQTFTWAVGTQHTISAPATVSVTGVQETFAGWSDGGAQSHTITVGAAGGTYTASYTTQNYTFAPLQASMTVAPGGVAIYQVAAQPGGYTGTIVLSQPPITVPPTPEVSCDLDSSHSPDKTWNPHYVTPIAQGTTPDGSAALLYVTADSNVALNACSSQKYTINYVASGQNPAVAAQPIRMYLTVAIAPSFTMSAIPQSQTALTQTYLMMAQSPNISGAVTVSLNAGSCAYLIGRPVLTLPAGATETAPVSATTTVSVGTLGCAPGVPVPNGLTFTGTAAAGPNATAAAQLTPLPPSTMLSPPPGTIIPGGPTTFVWQAGPGVTQTMLSVGSSQGAADFYAGSPQTGASAAVSVPAAAGTAYATLSSLTGSGWVAQSYSYTVSSQPGTGPLQLSGPPPAAGVPANGREVQYGYGFSSGDAQDHNRGAD